METKNSWILGWLLALGLVAISLVGCTQTDFSWNGGRTALGIRAIVNDSLALQSSCHGWRKSVEHPLSMDDMDDSEGCDHEGLHLVNYRSKQAFVWSDTINEFAYIGGQLSDSVVFGGDYATFVSFWKIGQKPVSRKIKSWTGSCSPSVVKNNESPDYQIRPWRDGKFLMLGASTKAGGDTCQYAVLDTSTGTVVQSRFANSDAWLAECEDITYLGGKVLCLKARIQSNSYGVMLVIDGTNADSAIWDSATWEITIDLLKWYGRQFMINHPTENNDGTNNVRAGKLLYKLNVAGDRIVQIEPAVWLTNWPYGFADSLGKKVYYGDDDFSLDLGD